MMDVRITKEMANRIIELVDLDTASMMEDGDESFWEHIALNDSIIAVMLTGLNGGK